MTPRHFKKKPMTLHAPKTPMEFTKYDPETFNVNQTLQVMWLQQTHWHHEFWRQRDMIFGNKKNKRFRSKPEHVKRYFYCDYEHCGKKCDKAYGTISHLNTHRARKRISDSCRPWTT
eukprot:NODE_414_length_7911_cov_0.926011.p8 type:complete len:117 gc:universal NODE_414_length_7911_cov_0.926011:4859-4509(-)